MHDQLVICALWNVKSETPLVHNLIRRIGHFGTVVLVAAPQIEKVPRPTWHTSRDLKYIKLVKGSYAAYATRFGISHI